MSATYDIPTLEKQVNESRLYTFNFSANLANVETLTGVTLFSAAPSGLTTGTPIFAGKLVQNRISGGVTDTLYKITVRVTTSDGNTLEGDAHLFVKET